MILSIVPELSSDVILSAPSDVKVIDYRMFNSLEIHPFIANYVWEYIEITLSRGIRAGYIKQLLVKSNILKARIPSSVNIDFEIVSRLMEIFPNSAARLRKAYLYKEDIKSILLEEGVTFE